LSDISPLIPAVVAGLIIVIGWLVVERFARRREVRSDLRDAAALFEATVDDVVELASKFYQTNGIDPLANSLAVSIKAKVQSLVPLLDILAGGGIQIDATDEMRLFRQAVTGGDFESAARTPRTAGAPMFLKMDAAGQNLTQVVRLGVFRSLIDRKASKPKRRQAKPAD